MQSSSTPVNATARKLELSTILDRLEGSHGSGTSMISLFVAFDGSLARTRQRLTEEYSFSSNIKSRV
jgi:peptide subunit release factor 1 (eRF1)